MTMSLKIKELELEGFRSFEEKTLITFPESGMVLIAGRHLDGSMSSGSGKSSIPIAISFALGYCSLPSTALKSWNSKKIRVRLQLSDGVNTIEIIRDPKLKLIENGIEYKGLSKGADERLTEILKTAPELISSLTYRPQRKHGRFLNSTDSDNKDFLSALLDLNSLETASDNLTREKTQLELQIANMTNSISKDTEMLSVLSGAKAKIPDAQKACIDAQQRYVSLSSPSFLIEAEQKLELIKTEIQKSTRLINQAGIAESDNNTIRNQLLTVEKEIQAIENNMCPTCKREWDLGQEKLNDLLDTKKQLLDRARSNISIIESVRPIKEAFKELTLEAEKITKQIGELSAPAEDARKNFHAAENLLQQLMAQSATCDRLESSIEKTKNSIQNLQNELEIAHYAAEILSKNGFLSVIFDDILKEIEYRSNQMIGDIPNVSTFSLSITSTHNTKSGATKKSISVKVIKDGEEIPVKSLSGGQQCSLELCTDLAVSESIRSRSGSPIGWLCLDEAMDGLDIENKKAALDVIRQKISGMVLIIDHSTEIKEGFEKVINVEFDGRSSRVKP